MGPGEKASPELIGIAEELGRQIARAGWITLTGGRNAGVMEAANRGAKSAGGLTIGILPTRDRDKISTYVDIPIITDMGSARNNINVLSSDIIIACGAGRGSTSEIALALKAEKKVVLLAVSAVGISFFREIGGPLIAVADSPQRAIEICETLLGRSI